MNVAAAQILMQRGSLPATSLGWPCTKASNFAVEVEVPTQVHRSSYLHRLAPSVNVVAMADRAIGPLGEGWNDCSLTIELWIGGRATRPASPSPYCCAHPASAGTSSAPIASDFDLLIDTRAE